MPIRPTLLAFLTAATFQPALPQTSSPSLTTGTKLVFVDVVVTDNKQNPVHNLTASHFTVLENNVPEHIKSFEEHTTASSAKPEPPSFYHPATSPTTPPFLPTPLSTSFFSTLSTHRTTPRFMSAISFAFSSKIPTERSPRHFWSQLISLASAAIHRRSQPPPSRG
jgi:hypothetical protein